MSVARNAAILGMLLGIIWNGLVSNRFIGNRPKQHGFSLFIATNSLFLCVLSKLCSISDAQSVNSILLPLPKHNSF